MKLNNEIIDLIIQDHSEIKQIYISGSGSVDYIKNPNDVDIILVLSSLDIPYPDYSLFQNLVGHEKVSVFSILDNIKEESLLELESNFLYCSGPFIKKIYSVENSIDIGETCNIFHNDIYKQECIKTIKEQLIRRKKSSYIRKPYRLLMSCFILNNKSYELTDDQIKTLNQVHDSKEMSEELWTWCEEIINKEAHQI